MRMLYYHYTRTNKFCKQSRVDFFIANQIQKRYDVTEKDLLKKKRGNKNEVRLRYKKIEMVYHRSFIYSCIRRKLATIQTLQKLSEVFAS